jgi:hypothetical protein
VLATLVTPSTSIALIATSASNSLARTTRPTSSAVRMIRPRLHQLSPTSSLKPIAMTTPTTTALTRRKPMMKVEYKVTWTTSSAVSGAVRGTGCGSSQTATTYAMTAAVVDRRIWADAGSAVQRTSFTMGSGTSGIPCPFPLSTISPVLGPA